MRQRSSPSPASYAKFKKQNSRRKSQQQKTKLQVFYILIVSEFDDKILRFWKYLEWLLNYQLESDQFHKFVTKSRERESKNHWNSRNKFGSRYSRTGQVNFVVDSLYLFHSWISWPTFYYCFASSITTCSFLSLNKF